MSDLKARITEALIARRTATTSGDPTKLRQHAEADADAVIEALHPTVTDGRLIADLYEEAIRFWFGECFPNVTAPWLLVDGIRGQLGGFITEELIGRERRIEELSADLDNAERDNRRLAAEVKRLEARLERARAEYETHERAYDMVDGDLYEALFGTGGGNG